MSVEPLSAAVLLDRLGVPKGRPLYVQASADWLTRAGMAAVETLAALTAWIGATGTLVMPSYPFHTTHREYLEGGPRFDVRRTPAAVGVMAEMFRRTRGVVRSLDPDFAIAAFGPAAAAFAGDAPAEPDPFGRDSSYQRMSGCGATLVGLGVSLNTTSFMHLIDSQAQTGYPSPVYEERGYTATVIDYAGQARQVARLALRPAFQQLTEPSAINRAMQPGPDVFQAMEINGAQFFRWDLDAWSAWCQAHATERATAGQWPCWLERLGRISSGAA